MIAKCPYVAVACIISMSTSFAQGPGIQDPQDKLLELEESTQETIQDLRAQIAALQQVQKAPSGFSLVPSSAEYIYGSLERRNDFK